jgi:hypothetical protein
MKNLRPKKDFGKRGANLKNKTESTTGKIVLEISFMSYLIDNLLFIYSIVRCDDIRLAHCFAECERMPRRGL